MLTVGKLLKVTALALQQLLNVTWPSQLSNVSTPELWSEIHHFLSSNEQMHPDRHLRFLNHDLVGFFDSIPQTDIIRSIHFLTSEFLDNNTNVLLVDPQRKVGPVHSGKSTYSVKSNMAKIHAEHIPSIIQFSFDACAFTAIGEVFQQTCGTSHGSPNQPHPLHLRYRGNRNYVATDVRPIRQQRSPPRQAMDTPIC